MLWRLRERLAIARLRFRELASLHVVGGRVDELVGSPLCRALSLHCKYVMYLTKETAHALWGLR